MFDENEADCDMDLDETRTFLELQRSTLKLGQSAVKTVYPRKQTYSEQSFFLGQRLCHSDRGHAS